MTALAAAPATAWLARQPLRRLGAVLVMAAVVAAFTGAALVSVPLGPIHLFAYRVLLVLTLTYLLAAVLYARFPLVPARLRPVADLLVFLGAWTVYAALNSFFVLDPAEYITHVGFIAMGALLCYLVVVFLGDERGLRGLVLAWLAMAVLLLGLGLAQHLMGFQLAISQFAGALDERRFIPTGTFPRVNQYASFVALAAALPLGWLATPRPRLRFLVPAVLMLALITYLVLVLDARTGVIALAAQLVTACLLLPVRRRALVFVAGPASLALAVVAVGPAVAATAALTTMDNIYSQAVSGEGSVGVRANLVRNGLIFFRDSGGLGVGAGNFNAWIEAHSAFSTTYQGGPDELPKRITYPHNWWIELLAEYGLLVFAGFIAFFIALFKRVVVAYRRTGAPDQRLIGRILIIALVAYLVLTIGPGHFAAFRPHWVVLALALAFVVAHGRPPRTGGPGREGQP